MAWVAVHKNGEEGIFTNKPIRVSVSGYWYDDFEIGDERFDSEISLPKGSIKKLIGRELSWEDNPVELKEEQP